MPLECSVCLAADGKDGKVIDTVCHHCGKPLCREHRVLILDEQFANQGAPVPRHAYHCPGCHQAYHARSYRVRSMPVWAYGRTLWSRFVKRLAPPWRRKPRTVR